MERRALIATHGYLARGFRSSLELLAGMSGRIVDINAYTDEEPGDYTVKIAEFVDAVADDEEAFIFTDIAGGSVNQKVVQLLASRPGGVPSNITLITDVNLMTLIAFMLESRPMTQEVIDELLGQIRPAQVHLEPASSSIDDEEDFLA